MQQKSHLSALPLRQSHLRFAHNLWTKCLQKGDWAIDATCGRGKDTLYLLQLISAYGEEGGVIALDIQSEAILSTHQYIHQQALHLAHRVHLFHQSHEAFPSIAYENRIGLIVYNLGYLPSGDQSLTTLTSTTLLSIEKALLLSSTLSITCYPGHPEGLNEQKALLAWADALNPKLWQAVHYQNETIKSAPSLLIIEKQQN